MCWEYAIIKEIKEMYELDIFPTVGLLLEEQSVEEFFNNKRERQDFFMFKITLLRSMSEMAALF